jgi:hypothetical protein
VLSGETAAIRVLLDRGATLPEARHVPVLLNEAAASPA